MLGSVLEELVAAEFRGDGDNIFHNVLPMVTVVLATDALVLEIDDACCELDNVSFATDIAGFSGRCSCC